MTDETRGEAESAVVDNLRGTRDAMTVKGVFGEAYELDGVTIIPVARVSGGAGGGGGEGTGPEDAGECDCSECSSTTMSNSDSPTPGR